jgi:hypothetical protein
MAEATANESLTKSQRALQAEAALAAAAAAVPTAVPTAAPKKPIIERGTVTKVKRVQLPPSEPQVVPKVQEEVEEVEEVEVKPVKIKKTAKKAETGEIKEIKEIKEKKVRGPKKLAQPTTLEGFYRAKDKRPTSFNFSQAGHAVAPQYVDKDEKVFPERTFQLPQYRPITQDEIDEQEQGRLKAIQKQYKVIEAKKEALREILNGYPAANTIRQVITANQAVETEESKLSHLISGIRYIETEENPTEKKVVLSNKYEERKLGYDIYVFKRRTFPLQEYFREITAGEEVQKLEGGGEDSILFIVDDQSPLGLHWPMDITVEKTKYFTLYQALLGELALSMNNNELHESILGTRSSRTLRNLIKSWTLKELNDKSDVIAKVAMAASLLNEFKEPLLQTKNKTIAYVDESENPDLLFGIGLEKEHPRLLNDSAWRGGNVWGKALEAERLRLKELNVIEKPDIKSAVSQTNAAITEGEQAKAKTGAIIAARRFKGN